MYTAFAMRLSTKVGIGFIAVGFVAPIVGGLLIGDRWDAIQDRALVVFLGACAVSVFAIRYRETAGGDS